MTRLQGVKEKILAFETFLDTYPEFQQKVRCGVLLFQSLPRQRAPQVVLIQVALQTTESNELAVGVADIVSRLNGRFSTLTYQPVVFLHTQDLTFSQYLALLTVADAFLVTSLREGMALRTHEFVECQEGRHRPLILSEVRGSINAGVTTLTRCKFAGSYSYSGFRSCIAINPWDARGTAKAIYEVRAPQALPWNDAHTPAQALTMSDDEASSRWEVMPPSRDLPPHTLTP
jgi:trehalose-6-phosphate synthase